MRTEPFLTPDNMDEKTQGWIEDIGRLARPRPDLVVERSRCALLVVDMLRYFAHPEGRVYLPSTAAVIPRISVILEDWRRWGGTVVFTRHCHTGPEDLGMLGRFFSDYIRCGERDSEIIDELSPLEDELVLRKTTYDSFCGTDLEEYLRDRGTEQVVITGVLTQMCCETTARSAFVRGFEVYVPADALTTSSEELHLGSLRSMATSCAVITSVAAICGGLA